MSWGTCTAGSNNIHFDFPPIMSDGRNFARWQPGAVINKEIRKENNIKTNSQYRQFLTENADSIIKSLNDKRGIKRYGFFYVPMDECLSRCVIDFSGRPELVWDVELGLEKIGEMDTELFHEFFKAFTNESKCNLHIKSLYGKNNHHIIESCFKAFAKSTRQAIEIDNRIKDIIPSSKGII